jgi:hypothetical protein
MIVSISLICRQSFFSPHTKGGARPIEFDTYRFLRDLWSRSLLFGGVGTYFYQRSIMIKIMHAFAQQLDDRHNAIPMVKEMKQQG